MPAPSGPASSRGGDATSVAPTGSERPGHRGWVVTLRCPPEHAELLSDNLWAAGTSGVAEVSEDTRVLLIAGFDDRAAADRAADATVAAGAELVSIEPTDTAWVSSWRRHAAPVAVAPFTVRLPEHEPVTDADLVIEPGPSFGFGHSTTCVALQLLAEIGVASSSVLDIGTGSGILAVAAGRLGADPIEAVELDAEAAAIARHNARRNDVSVIVRCLDATDEIPARPGGYDVVMINMTAGLLVPIAPSARAVLAPTGSLIVAGLLAEQETAIAEAFAPLLIDRRVERDGWTGLVFVTGA